MKKIIILLLTILEIFADSIDYENIKQVQYLDIEVTHTYEDKTKDFIIRRELDPKCLNLGITHDTTFSGNVANKNVTNECKKTFVTTLGSIQPINMDGIGTVAELDVLAHIINTQEFPDKYILIDSRKSVWYENLTIPSAVNIPYTDIAYDPDFQDEHDKLLATLNIKKVGKKYDFTNAKKAILFCNGNWCVQSSRAIKELIRIGYPKDKLFWYRGGLQDWIALSLTTIKGAL